MASPHDDREIEDAMQCIARSMKQSILKHLRRMAWEDYKRSVLTSRREQAVAALRRDQA
ncbi:hypothetical protein [Streptomyces arenae]|uniref:hypothetical protein n=1 Tax=Streptomyces arenae TaxID=29301 RepID=UPI00265A0FF0|nr:hypothetical protein [Streptomyces arenae]MCG7203989.1 hypothetical protein [Streptomyces arenae]